MQVTHVHIHQEVCLQYCCVVSPPPHLLGRVRGPWFQGFQAFYFYKAKEGCDGHKILSSVHISKAVTPVVHKRYKVHKRLVARYDCNSSRPRRRLEGYCLTTSVVKCLGLVEPDTIAEAFMSKSN